MATWINEQNLAWTPDGSTFISPIILEGGQRVVYIIDQGYYNPQHFYKYNITTKQYTELTPPTYICNPPCGYVHFNRTLAPSPDGTQLPGRRTEIEP